MDLIPGLRIVLSLELGLAISRRRVHWHQHRGYTDINTPRSVHRLITHRGLRVLTHRGLRVLHGQCWVRVCYTGSAEDGVLNTD